MNKELDKLQFPEGTIIHINGFPFWLSTDTVLFGRKGNANLTGLEFSEISEQET